MDAVQVVPVALAFAGGLAGLDLLAWAVTGVWGFFRGTVGR